MKIFVAVVLFWLLLVMGLEIAFADTIVVDNGGTTQVCTKIGNTVICN